MTRDNEIVVKHLLGRIAFKSRTQNVDADVQIDKSLNFKDLAPLIEKNKGYEKYYLNNTLLLTLADVRTSEEDNVIYLMINSNPQNAKSTVIKNTKTKHRTEYTPNIGAGDRYEHSTHVVIRMTPGVDGDHDILLEKTENVNTGIFKLFLDKILFEIARANESDYTVKAKMSNEKIRFKPVVDIHSKPDENFLNNIRAGNISDIMLIKSKPQELLIPDENITVKTKEHSIKIDVSSIQSDALGFIRKVGKFFSSSQNEVRYDKIKIHYKNPDSTTGKGGSVALLDSQTLNMDAKETLVTKKHIIRDFKGQIKSSYECINDEIAKKMLSCL